MNKEKETRRKDRAAAELHSARAEFASLDRHASPSRAERAAFRLKAAQDAWEKANATELAA